MALWKWHTISSPEIALGCWLVCHRLRMHSHIRPQAKPCTAWPCVLLPQACSQRPACKPACYHTMPPADASGVSTAACAATPRARPAAARSPAPAAASTAGLRMRGNAAMAKGNVTGERGTRSRALGWVHCVLPIGCHASLCMQRRCSCILRLCRPAQRMHPCAAIAQPPCFVWVRLQRPPRMPWRAYRYCAAHA
jgi:hypothetical protein